MTTHPYWERWYARRQEPVAMGLRSTYGIAAQFLDLPGAVLEDWGGGTGWLRIHIKRATYRVVDGTANRWCDITADLSAYRSAADCILIRHVLEHNHDWAVILANAAASYRHRFVLVLFTPLVAHTANDTSRRQGAAYYSFAFDDLVAITGLPLRRRSVGGETMLFFQR